jgi:hypothetical protein
MQPRADPMLYVALRDADPARKLAGQRYARCPPRAGARQTAAGRWTHGVVHDAGHLWPSLGDPCAIGLPGSVATIRAAQ